MVCLVCFCKKKHMRSISAFVKSVIEDQVFSDLSNPEWDWLPKAICSSCDVLVRLLKKTPARLFEIADFSSLTPPETLPSTRSQTAQQSSCVCSVCTVGKLNGGEFNSFRVLMAKAVGRPFNLEPVFIQ